MTKKNKFALLDDTDEVNVRESNDKEDQKVAAKEIVQSKPDTSKPVKNKDNAGSLTQEINLDKLESKPKKRKGQAKSVYFSGESLDIIEKIQEKKNVNFSDAVSLIIKSVLK